MNNITPPRAQRGALDRYVEIKTTYGPIIAYVGLMVGFLIVTGIVR